MISRASLSPLSRAASLVRGPSSISCGPGHGVTARVDEQEVGHGVFSFRLSFMLVGGQIAPSYASHAVHLGASPGGCPACGRLLPREHGRAGQGSGDPRASNPGACPALIVMASARRTISLTATPSAWARLDCRVAHPGAMRAKQFDQPRGAELVSGLRAIICLCSLSVSSTDPLSQRRRRATCAPLLLVYDCVIDSGTQHLVEHRRH